MEVIDDFKTQILICFEEMTPDDCTITNIAKVFGVDKYKVSRAVQWLKNAGMVDNSNPRSPKLTEYGKTSAKKFKQRLDIAAEFLISQKLPDYLADKDAMSIAISCSDATIEVMQKIAQEYKLKSIFKGVNKFDGARFCKSLKDGTYYLAFTFNKSKVKNGSVISMANDGFEHPCRLVVENGVGVIYLKTLKIKQVSGLNGSAMTGKLSSLKYYDGYTFKAAGKNGDYVFFPASILSFTNYDGEQAMSGSAPLKVSASVGKVHMPESIAILNIIF